MPFTFFQEFKVFLVTLLTAGEPTKKKIITVDVEAGLWNGMRVEDFNPTVTVHSPSVTVHSPSGVGVK